MKAFKLLLLLFLISCGQNTPATKGTATSDTQKPETTNKRDKKMNQLEQQQSALPITYDFIEGFWMELEDLAKLRSARITKPFPQSQGGFLGYETSIKEGEYYIHGSQSTTRLIKKDNQYLSDPEGYDLKGWSFEFREQGTQKTLLATDEIGKLMQTLHYMPANDNLNRFKDNSNLFWPYTYYFLKGKFLTQTPDGTIGEATLTSSLKVNGLKDVNSFRFTSFGNELVLEFNGTEKKYFMCRPVKDGFDLYTIDLPEMFLKRGGNIWEHNIRAKSLAWKFRKEY